MGGIFGGGSTTTTSKTKTDMGPWKDQAPFLKTAFTDAKSLYEAGKGLSYPNIPQYVGMNPTQMGAVTAGVDQGTSNLAAADALRNVGAQGLSGFNAWQGNAGALSSGAFDQGNTQAANTMAGAVPMALRAAGAGTGAALHAATTDPTQGNISAAGQYANNPYVDGMVSAASRDVVRNLGEDILPGINANAVATGNMNSSRTGAAEAIARRGAEDRVADISAGIRGDLYSKGLQIGETARQANMNGALSAGGLGLSAANAGVNAEAGANANNIANQNVRLGALSELGDATRAGGAMLTDAANLGNTGVSGIGQAGSIVQQDAMSKNQDQLRQQLATQAFPWANLGNYYGIVGANNWGQNGTTSTTQTTQGASNPLGGILGIGSLLAAPFTGGTSLGGMAMSGLGSLFGGGGLTSSLGGFSKFGMK